MGLRGSHCPQQGSRVRSGEGDAETRVLIEHHFTLRWARPTNICSCSWQGNLDSRVVWIFKIFFTAKREKIQVRDYSHLRIPKQFQFQVFLHPRPPIRDCFHPQSISDTPAAPGTFISEPTISHQEGGDRLLSDFSVPISYPLSTTLSPDSKGSRDGQS